ncbi:hypothetical protein [Thalassoroseus pseudoceratinae]|uniref:hypothetical protein n=1 Tax=Thalassoroseus pseudoceratinae TaxID=2713176 RepID=UPI0014218434|nr:hypothetical protein [Thalassoroseus pseudoceratinae]
MTEQEWQPSEDPDALLVEFRGVGNDPRLREWCCECLRRVWEHLADEGREAVTASEQFARGAITEAELAVAREKAESAVRKLTSYGEKNAQRAAAQCASQEIDALGIARFIGWGAAYAIGSPETLEGQQQLARERKAQLELLRQIFAVN